MKKKFFSLTIITIVSLVSVFLARGIYYMVSNATYHPQDGDVIFHVSKSSQSTAIQIGTLSRYSHCGVIIMKDGKPYVLEAERGVELTPMDKWINRGIMGNHYRVMRLKNKQDLTLDYTLGGKYDRNFQFNNGKYYCSELVWEMYANNGILLSEPKEMQDYYCLFLPMIKRHIKERGFKLDQEVVAPVDLVKSKKLKTVSYGYWKPFWNK
jgi:hypothetical protein